jgi:hypothetical protein
MYPALCILCSNRLRFPARLDHRLRRFPSAYLPAAAKSLAESELLDLLVPMISPQIALVGAK